VILALVAGVLWGSIGYFVRRLYDLEYSTLSIVFVRMSIAAVIMLVFLAVTGRLHLLRVKLRDLWWFITAGLLSSILLNFFYSESIRMNPLSVASILLASAPIFVVIISALVFKERITSRKVTSLALVFIGCVMVSGLFGGGDDSIAQGHWFSALGFGAGFTSALGWGLYAIVSRVALNKGYNSLTINFYTFACGAAACAPFTEFSTVARSVTDHPLDTSILLLLHTLCAALLPYALFTYALKFIDTGTASILIEVDPVAAALIGLFVYHENLTAVVIIGIVVVCLGIAVLNQKPRGPASDEATTEAPPPAPANDTMLE
jgi:drug/metabolite transporter (DMT)-like permease